MEKILIATHNPAKLTELKEGCRPLIKKGINLVSLLDLKIDDEPEETGKTFEENAKLKAKYFFERAKMPTISDDGGLTINCLNGEPGIRSRRWIGDEATDEQRIVYTLSRLQGVAFQDRTAYLNVCLCFYDGKDFIYVEEKVKGYISDRPSRKRIEGYPYRSLFIVEKFGKYYDELTKEEHRQINHRLKAIGRLVEKIPLRLLK